MNEKKFGEQFTYQKFQHLPVDRIELFGTNSSAVICFFATFTKSLRIDKSEFCCSNNTFITCEYTLSLCWFSSQLSFIVPIDCCIDLFMANADSFVCFVINKLIECTKHNRNLRFFFFNFFQISYFFMQNSPNSLEKFGIYGVDNARTLFRIKILAHKIERMTIPLFGYVFV